MRVIAVLMFAVLSGCALAKEFNGEAATQRRIQREEREKQLALKEANKQQALKPGTPYYDFLAIWGEPTRTEFVNDQFVLHYLDEPTPLTLKFTNNKLTEWTTNTAELEKREARRSAKEERDWQKRKAMAESFNRGVTNAYAPAPAYNPVPVSAPKQVNCTSSTYFGNTNTNCNGY